MTLATGTAEREATPALRDRRLTGRRYDGEKLTTDDSKSTVNHWGGGKGKWAPRDFLDEEAPVVDRKSSWGERTGDLYLNGQGRFANGREDRFLTVDGTVCVSGQFQKRPWCRDLSREETIEWSRGNLRYLAANRLLWHRPSHTRRGNR